MRLTYHATTDVAYLSLRSLAAGELLGPTLLLETDREFGGAVALDFSLTDGQVVGLEFQMASACLPAELLASKGRRDGEGLSDRLEERIIRRTGYTQEPALLRRRGLESRRPRPRRAGSMLGASSTPTDGSSAGTARRATASGSTTPSYRPRSPRGSSRRRTVTGLAPEGSATIRRSSSSLRRMRSIAGRMIRFDRRCHQPVKTTLGSRDIRSMRETNEGYDSTEDTSD